jgi:hypothetical protein
MGGTAMNKPHELYACLYVKEFSAQALLRLRPELHEKPCVVMEVVKALEVNTGDFEHHPEVATLGEEGRLVPKAV